MPRPRSIMRRIREVLRLRLGEGLSGRQTSSATGIPLTTIWHYVDRARRAGLEWPLPEEMDDERLELRLFGEPLPTPIPSAKPERALPDWSLVHREIRRKGVTLQLLHLEYLEQHPQGYKYSQLGDLCGGGEQKGDVPMERDQRAGERVLVYFPGQTIP